MFCSKLIQKSTDSEGRLGVHWYSISQEAAIRAWMIEQDMWGCRPVQAPMPDKEELLGGTRAVTALEHKWLRSVIEMMCYYALIICSADKMGHNGMSCI